MRTKLDETPKEYKWRKREKNLGCTICPPHRGENARNWRKYRKKKAFQLDPNRGHRHKNHIRGWEVLGV